MQILIGGKKARVAKHRIVHSASILTKASLCVDEETRKLGFHFNEVESAL